MATRELLLFVSVYSGYRMDFHDQKDDWQVLLEPQRSS